MKWVLAISFGLSSVALAQQASIGARFEVASIKPVKELRRDLLPIHCTGGPATADLSTWICPQVNLSWLLVTAFDLEPYQFSAPDWMITTWFSVAARIPPGTTKEQFREMQLGLLQDRFGLTFHWGQRDATVYTLVEAEGGVKMKESAPDAPPAETNWTWVAGATIGKDHFPVFPEGTEGLMGANNHMRWRSSSVTISDLIKVLGFTAGSDVLDGTGLTRKYDVDMYWEQPSLDLQTNPPPFDGPTLEKALLDRLGLRLQPGKGTVRTFVVDHVAKVPSEN